MMKKPSLLKGMEATNQATFISSVYAETTMFQLLKMLDVDKKDAGWRDKLAPFAPVWAAMIAAAASENRTAIEGGFVEKPQEK